MVHDSYASERVAGVGFGDLERALDDHGFPATGHDLIESFGDRRLEHQRGEARLGDVLEPLADETFDSPGAVHRALLSVIGDDAVGRKAYSDRDPPRRDEPEAVDRSF